MNQESRHFFVKAPAGRPRLTSRGLDSNDHVAEKLSALVAVLTLQQRKRQDVGRRALAPVLEIQRLDLVVRHDCDREFRIRLTDLFERSGCARPEQVGIERGELSRSRRQRESNRHSSLEPVALRAACFLWASSIRPVVEFAS